MKTDMLVQTQTQIRAITIAFVDDTHEEIRLKWHFFMCHFFMKVKDNQICSCAMC